MHQYMDHMNFTNTTTSWNIINLHNTPMIHHHDHHHHHHQDQDQDHHPLEYCIPITWPLAFTPLHTTQDQEPVPAKIKNRYLDQEMDGCDDIGHCIPVCPFAFPLHHMTQEQEQDQEPVPAKIKNAKKGGHGQEPVLTKIKNRDHDQETDGGDDTDEEELGAMKEMMYKMAAMRPVDVDPAAVRRPRRRNVRISDDPQSVAARRRRERISERMRVLQRLVPGGAKMDTAAMLDEAARYVKFLKRQIRRLQPSDDHHRPLPPPPPAPASIRVPSCPQYI